MRGSPLSGAGPVGGGPGWAAATGLGGLAGATRPGLTGIDSLPRRGSVIAPWVSDLPYRSVSCSPRRWPSQYARLQITTTPTVRAASAIQIENMLTVTGRCRSKVGAGAGAVGSAFRGGGGI